MSMSPDSRLPVHCAAHKSFRFQQRAKEEIAEADSYGVSVRGIATRRAGRVEHFDTGELEISGADYDADGDDVVGRAEGGMPPPAMPRRGKTLRDLLLEFRDRPRSALLYFPHVELLFLLFAFEGAVASQLGAMRERDCPWVLYVASTALVRRSFRMSCNATVVLGTKFSSRRHFWVRGGRKTVPWGDHTIGRGHETRRRYPAPLLDQFLSVEAPRTKLAPFALHAISMLRGVGQHPLLPAFP